ncbi:MAG TPA: ATP-dependent DNA ligase [Plantibacter sp.]|uniref:DUF7882 family protein n=1 Tax=unclassified Plantibacter TaxID=2624265 RepID=UPI002CF624F5|nr:ATP-dependent DNA ligase [Plantibacter sp.]
MGKLIYGSEVSITFEDRLLAHLQFVIGAKLRRNEAFYFGWKDDPRAGDGRSVIWIHPSVPLRFKYSGSIPIDLNRQWIEALNITANSAHGLSVVAEPAPSRPAPSRTGQPA